MQAVTPRYKVGSIGPIGAGEPVTNANLRPEPLLPEDIVFIRTGLALSDYTVEGVEDGLSRYWNCVDELMREKPNRIGWGGFPISAQMGRERCLRLIDETRERTGIPASNDGEAVVAAFQRLGAGRVAVASRWANALNEGVVRYLNHAGIEVLTITTEGQMGAQAFSMSLDMGIKLVFQLSRQAMKQAPKAEALFVPGGTWHALGCIPALEEDFGIPVVTNSIAGTWSLIHDRIAPPVTGWGTLLATP